MLLADDGAIPVDGDSSSIVILSIEISCRKTCVAIYVLWMFVADYYW